MRDIEDKNTMKKLKKSNVQTNNKSSERRSGRLAVKKKCKYNIYAIFNRNIKNFISYFLN